MGGFAWAPFAGLGALSPHPVPTIAMDQRNDPFDHFSMKMSPFGPNDFRLDFDYFFGGRVKESYTGPIAVLVGPGAVSAGDMSALWSTFLPNVRTFGKSTAMAVGLPTQPAIGTHIDLGPDWLARVAETNTWRVGAPKDFLIHTEFPVDEPVWLQPDDVAVGTDTVVERAIRWLNQQISQ